MSASSWAIGQRERGLLRSAPTDLPVLALADDVSQLLAQVIDHLGSEAGRPARDDAAERGQALWLMAIIAFRAMRAAMQILSIGYEDQAVVYQRLIDELHNRAQKVRSDESGEYARQWLAGRGLDKGAKLAGQDFWEFLSGPAHANARAIFDWLAVSKDDGSTAIVVSPERRPVSANAALAYMAGEGRDIAGMLATVAGVQIDLSEIDRRIRDAHATWIPEVAGTSDPGTDAAR